MGMQQSSVTNLKRDGFDLTIDKKRSRVIIKWAYPQQRASGGMVVTSCTDYRISEDHGDASESTKHLMVSMHAGHRVEHRLVMPESVMEEIRPMLEAAISERVKPEGIKLFPFVKTVILVGLLSFAALIAVDIISTKMVMSGNCSAVSEALKESIPAPPPTPETLRGAMKPVTPSGTAETWMPPASMGQP